MPRYKFTLTDQEKEQLQKLIQKGGKGYRIKHAQILLKLDNTPENNTWTYKRIQTAYNATNSTISSVAKRFVTEGIEAALAEKNN